MDNIGILDSGIVALLGYAVVFFGLILLMTLITILGKAFTASQKEKKKAEPAPAPVVKAAAPAAPEAPGSAGQVKLYNVEPRTAAMLMAIVADKMGKPINELRFISIREVEQ
mgnify:CR=1 FL=1